MTPGTESTTVDPRFQRLKELFQSARELPVGEQPLLLADSCHHDPQLRAELQELLAAAEHCGDFLRGSGGNAHRKTLWNLFLSPHRSKPCH